MDTTHHRAHENLAFSHTSMANIANNSLVHDMMTEKKKNNNKNGILNLGKLVRTENYFEIERKKSYTRILAAEMTESDISSSNELALAIKLRES